MSLCRRCYFSFRRRTSVRSSKSWLVFDERLFNGVLSTSLSYFLLRKNQSNLFLLLMIGMILGTFSVVLVRFTSDYGS